MAGRLENQMLQWCGVDSTQSNETVQQENIKCTSDNSGAFYPSTTSTSASSYYSYPQAGEYAPRLGTYSQWGSSDGTSSKSPNKDYITQFSMSGGPPQHPHGRQAPPNSAWNHLQVPNYYPARQPQHAHMSSELPMLATHQPTWHTPTTTEPSKGLQPSPLFNLQQMLGSERPFPRHSPGVDLTLTRNGSQNGDIPPAPISLSVRDTKQINSLPVGAALDGDRAVELTKGPSPGLAQDCQPSPKSIRRPAKRMDSIIDRLNTSSNEKQPQSVIVTAASSSHDENSNSSQGTAVASAPTPTPIRDEEMASPVSNEDSLDSNKSRRKRKPSKTMKVAKEDEAAVPDNEKVPPVSEPEAPPEPVVPEAEASAVPTPQPEPETVKQSPARRRSNSEPPTSPSSASKSRRKTLSESETIDNIAAMVAASKEEIEASLPPAEPLPVPHTAPLAAQPVGLLIEPAVEPASTPPAGVIGGQVVTQPVVTAVPVGLPVAVPVGLPIPAAVPLAAPPAMSIPPLEEVCVKEPPEPVSIQCDIPTAKPVSVITRDHNCSSDSILPHPPDVQTPPVECSSEFQEKENPPEAAAAPQLVTLAQKKAGDTQCFVAVEDELEKMFAGIADSENEKQPETDPLAIASTSQVGEGVSSTSNDLGGISKNGTHKRGRPKGSKNGSRRPSESNSTESTPRKKHKGIKKQHDELEDELLGKNSFSSKTSMGQKSKKSKKGFSGKGPNKIQLNNNKPDVVKDVYSYDSGSNASSSRSKGPFIQIKGPRDSPISVSIVNTPSNEDDPEKPGKQYKNKKFHDDSEYRHKVRSKGLHCSTLSNKYDAQTRDASWICVFCKRGPHATDPQLPGPSPFTLDTPQYSPGDLFGPYVISTDCPEYQRRLEDPFDTLFKSKKSAVMTGARAPGGVVTVLGGAMAAAAGSAGSVGVLTGLGSVGGPLAGDAARHGKRLKKRQSSERGLRESLDGSDLGSKDYLFGMVEVTANSFEVWVHEDCVIWGPGVYLVGPKIMGLEGAVWGACSVGCKRCGLRGAAVCCLKRGCGSVMHIGCAKLSNWKLDEDNYKAYCTDHCGP